MPGAKKLDKDSLSKTWDLYNLNMSMHEEELKEYFATVHSKKPEIVKFINANKKNIDYVDIDAGSNIEFEGKGAHELADKVKSKFGVRVTKEETEEVELNDIDENFSPAMITKLKKAYGPLKGKKIAPGGLMKIFDKIDKNKNALIQLFKADIPFVSQMAASRLILKHNMKGVEINKLREELDEQIKTFNRNALTPLEKSELAKHFDKLANDRTTTRNEKPYYQTLSRYVMGNVKPFEFNDMIGGAPEQVLGSVSRNVMKIIGKAKAKSFIPGFKEELDKEDKPTVKKVIDKLKKASKAHADQSKSLEKDLQDDVDKTIDTIQQANDSKRQSMRSILADIWKVNEGKSPFEKDEGFASDAQRRAAFASGYKEKGKKKKEEVENSGKTMTGKKPTKVEIEPEVK